LTELVGKQASLFESSHLGVPIGVNTSGVPAGVTFVVKKPGRYYICIIALFLVGYFSLYVVNPSYFRSGETSILDCLCNFFGGLLEIDRVSRLFIYYVIILN
jgi:hypothetical protein